MSEKIVAPEFLEDHIDDISKYISINKDNIVKVIGRNSEENAVMMSQSLWNSIQETLYLEKTGTLNEIRKSMKNNHEDSWFIIENMVEIDWEDL